MMGFSYLQFQVIPEQSSLVSIKTSAAKGIIHPAVIESKKGAHRLIVEDSNPLATLGGRDLNHSGRSFLEGYGFGITSQSSSKHLN
jgi:hypothetical protein